MLLPILIVGVALFTVAFTGISNFIPTIFGLASVVGLLFGVYFVWQGVSGNDSGAFGWGCVLLAASGGILVFLKTSFGD